MITSSEEAASWQLDIPVDTGRKLNVHKTFRRLPERLMYVQFTSCVCWDGISVNEQILLAHLLLREKVSLQNIEQGTHISKYKATHCFTMKKYG